jgi:hypothetical protein
MLPRKEQQVVTEKRNKTIEEGDVGDMDGQWTRQEYENLRRWSALERSNIPMLCIPPFSSTL